MTVSEEQEPKSFLGQAANALGQQVRSELDKQIALERNQNTAIQTGVAEKIRGLDPLQPTYLAAVDRLVRNAQEATWESNLGLEHLIDDQDRVGKLSQELETLANYLDLSPEVAGQFVATLIELGSSTWQNEALTAFSQPILQALAPYSPQETVTTTIAKGGATEHMLTKVAANAKPTIELAPLTRRDPTPTSPATKETQDVLPLTQPNLEIPKSWLQVLSLRDSHEADAAIVQMGRIIPELAELCGGTVPTEGKVSQLAQLPILATALTPNILNNSRYTTAKTQANALVAALTGLHIHPSSDQESELPLPSRKDPTIADEVDKFFRRKDGSIQPPYSEEDLIMPHVWQAYVNANTHEPEEAAVSTTGITLPVQIDPHPELEQGLSKTQ